MKNKRAADFLVVAICMSRLLIAYRAQMCSPLSRCGSRDGAFDFIVQRISWSCHGTSRLGHSVAYRVYTSINWALLLALELKLIYANVVFTETLSKLQRLL